MGYSIPNSSAFIKSRSIGPNYWRKRAAAFEESFCSCRDVFRKRPSGKPLSLFYPFNSIVQCRREGMASRWLTPRWQLPDHIQHERIFQKDLPCQERTQERHFSHLITTDS